MVPHIPAMSPLVCRPLKHSVNVTTLTLSDRHRVSGLDKSAAESLADVLATTPLQELILEAQLSNRAISILAAALASNRTLNKLRLAFSRCSSDAYYVMLLEAIGGSRAPLRSLLLHGPAQVTKPDSLDNGAHTEALVRLLLAKRLTELDLSFNCFMDEEGAAAIGDMLAGNGTLQRLHLNACRIGDAGAGAIGQGLAHNSSLKDLSLSDDDVGDEGAAVIGKVLADNSTLECLSLRGNYIGVAGAHVLAADRGYLR